MSHRSSSADLVRLDWQPLGRRIEVVRGTRLTDAARLAGVELVATCGGVGLCDGCRIQVAESSASPLTALERAALGDSLIRAGWRLACQADAIADATIFVPPDSLSAPQRLQTETSLSEFDHDRGAAASVTSSGTRCGVAIDLGTTKIAAYLVDLTSGRVLASSGRMNPQIARGEDVMSRVAYAGEDDARRRELQVAVTGVLNDMIAELCDVADRARDAIERAVIVGNTAMHHFVAGLPVAPLGQAPYAPVTCLPLDIAATDMGLDLGRAARVYLPPNIAGFVGGDHVAVLVATRVVDMDRLAVIVDVGTNTEMSVAAGGNVWSCSCASGPAFEGAHISHGMRAAAGAIERVKIVGPDVRVHTIGGQPAVGICGSGILDAVAELHRARLVNRFGAIAGPHPSVRRGPHGVEFLLVSEAGTATGRDIVVTRADVNEVQLAKAAIRTGLEILLQTAGVAAGDVESFIVAGAFGTYLDVGQATAIGMFPAFPRATPTQVGNAAGAGARQMLVSDQCRHRAESIATSVRHVELTNHPSFQDWFARALLF